jgi:hypothetical protein
MVCWLGAIGRCSSRRLPIQREFRLYNFRIKYVYTFWRRFSLTLFETRMSPGSGAWLAGWDRPCNRSGLHGSHSSYLLCEHTSVQCSGKLQRQSLLPTSVLVADSSSDEPMHAHHIYDAQ